jgi:hypothetical protein
MLQCSRRSDGRGKISQISSRIVVVAALLSFVEMANSVQHAKPIIAIVACTRDGGIGKQGTLPFARARARRQAPRQPTCVIRMRCRSCAHALRARRLRGLATVHARHAATLHAGRSADPAHTHPAAPLRGSVRKLLVLVLEFKLLMITMGAIASRYCWLSGDRAPLLRRLQNSAVVNLRESPNEANKDSTHPSSTRSARVVRRIRLERDRASL